MPFHTEAPPALITLPSLQNHSKPVTQIQMLPIIHFVACKEEVIFVNTLAKVIVLLHEQRVPVLRSPPARFESSYANIIKSLSNSSNGHKTGNELLPQCGPGMAQCHQHTASHDVQDTS